MAWYYVKSGGTATGDGGRETSQRTGTWSGTASEYYDSIKDALAATTDPIDDDFILVSHLHDKTITEGSSILVNSTGDDNGNGLIVASVDDANQDEYLPGAVEENDSSGIDWDFRNHGLVAGVTLKAATTGGASALSMLIADRATWRFIDSIFEADAALMLGAGSQGCSVDLVNCDLNGNTGLDVNEGNMVTWRGGKLLSTGGFNNIGGGTLTMAHFELYGVDLSDVTTMFEGTAPAEANNPIYVKLVNCELNASVSLPSDTYFKMPYHRFEMWGCDDSAGDDLHRVHIQDGAGKAVNNDAKFEAAQ